MRGVSSKAKTSLFDMMGLTAGAAPSKMSPVALEKLKKEIARRVEAIRREQRERVSARKKSRNSPKKIRPVGRKRLRACCRNAGPKSLFDIMGLDASPLFAGPVPTKKSDERLPEIRLYKDEPLKRRGKLAPGCVAKTVERGKKRKPKSTQRISLDHGSWLKKYEAWKKKDAKIPWRVAEGERAEKLALYVLQSHTWLPAFLSQSAPDGRLSEMKHHMQFGQSGGDGPDVDGMGGERARGIEFRWQAKGDDSSMRGSHKELLLWKDLLDISMRILHSKDRPKWIPGVKRHAREQKAEAKRWKKEERERKKRGDEFLKRHEQRRQELLRLEKRVSKVLERQLKRKPTAQEIAKAIAEMVK